jgi:cytochrome b
MRRTLLGAAVVLAAWLVLPAGAAGGTRGADELFWVPTFEQALAMAEHTGRPIFLLHYTCVGETSPTYSGPSTVW